MKVPISVIVPAFNAAENVGRLACSLAGSNYKVYELFVVDDGSADGTAEAVAGFSARIISLQKRMGPACARNIGAREASGDILFFIDSDVVLGDGALGIVAAAFDERPDLDGFCMLTSKIPANPGYLPSYMALSERFWLHNRTLNGRRSVTVDNGFSARCGAIRKALFDKMGGFDTRYKLPSIEDTDFIYKLPKGSKIVLSAEHEIAHIWPTSFMKIIRSYCIRSFLWAGLFLRKRRLDIISPATGREGVKRSLALLSAASLILSLLYLKAAYLFYLFSCAYFAANFDFFRYLYKEKGVRFALVSIAMHYLSSIAITISALLGVIRYFAMSGVK